MKSKGCFVITVVCLTMLLVAALAFFFFGTERYTYSESVPEGPRFRQNPFYALEKLYRELGVETEGRNTIGSLPRPSGSVLMWLPTDREPLRARADDLREWVEEGGHLVVVPRVDWSATEAPEDPLLEPYGIVAGEGKPFQTPGPDPLTEAELRDERTLVAPYGLQPEDLAHEQDWFNTGPPTLPITYLDAPASANAEALAYLDHLPETTPDEALILTMRSGQGRLTVLCHAEMLKKKGLKGNAARSRLAWRIVAPPDDPVPERIVIVRSDEVPPLSSLIWQHAWTTVISGLVLLVVWIYGSSRRFGPLLPPRTVDRRSLVEHIDAAGDFLWRQGASASLIEGARDAFQERLRRRRPELLSMRTDDLAVHLAEELGGDAQRIRRAIIGEPPTHPDEFAEAIYVLERLRRAL